MNNQNNNQNVNSNAQIAMIGTIPKGVVLVSENIFTGDIHVFGQKRAKDGTLIRESRSGLYLKLPWYKDYKIISTHVQHLDTPTEKTKSADLIDIYYDTDYMFRIVNPVIYQEAENAARKNVTGPIKLTDMIAKDLNQIIENYIHTAESQILYRMTSESLISRITDEKKVEFLNEYGIEVTQVLLTGVKVPETIKKEAEKAALDKIKRENDLKNARTEKAIKEMQAEADATKITKTGEAVASKIKSWIESGMSSEDVAKALINSDLVNGTNPNTIVLAGSMLGNSLNNSNFDMLAMFSSLFKMMNQQSQNNNNTVQPDQTQSSVNIPAQPIAPAPASNPTANTNSDIVPNEAVDALKKAGLIDKDTAYGNVIWSGLSTDTYDYLVSQGFNPPINNQNNPNFHI